MDESDAQWRACNSLAITECRLLIAPRRPLSGLLHELPLAATGRCYLCQYELTYIDWLHSSFCVLTGLVSM
jgi:hypothetical protein